MQCTSWLASDLLSLNEHFASPESRPLLVGDETKSENCFSKNTFRFRLPNWVPSFQSCRSGGPRPTCLLVAAWRSSPANQYFALLLKAPPSLAALFHPAWYRRKLPEHRIFGDIMKISNKWKRLLSSRRPPT